MQLVVLAGLANNFAVPTFAQQKETVDPEVRQQIAAIGKKWDEAGGYPKTVCRRLPGMAPQQVSYQA